MEESWKPVRGYEGHYQVSNKGQVRQIKKMRKGTSGKILKPRNSLGYSTAHLSLSGVCKSVKIHRMVAEAFILNPDNKQFVNHINSVRNDNRVENLEWCSHKENITHALNVGSFQNAERVCYKGENYPSLRSASRSTGDSIATIKSQL